MTQRQKPPAGGLCVGFPREMQLFFLPILRVLIITLLGFLLRLAFVDGLLLGLALGEFFLGFALLTLVRILLEFLLELRILLGILALAKLLLDRLFTLLEVYFLQLRILA